MPTIFVINGPNLNLLGTRQPETYGYATLEDVQRLCGERTQKHGFDLVFHQSNHEGEIIDTIHEARRSMAADQYGGSPHGTGSRKYGR